LADYHKAFTQLLSVTAKRDGELVGRIPIMKKEEANPAQLDLIERAERARQPLTIGPTAVFMQNMELNSLLRNVLNYINLKSGLGPRQKEDFGLRILSGECLGSALTTIELRTLKTYSLNRYAMVFRYAHAAAARLAGVSEAAIEAIRFNRAPPIGSLKEDEAPLYDLLSQLLTNKRAS
ncbi:hypothetical protein HDU93_004474, partial [Gonapodya sp. JEL0774]